LRELQDGSYQASLSMPAQLTCPRLPLLPVHSQVRSGIGDTCFFAREKCTNF
jgi:hypothetical protein